jgi:hypothetical protein
MNMTRMWLALAAGVTMTLFTFAAPAPNPESQGPISDALRLREKMPTTAAPTVMKVVQSGDNLEVERRSTTYVQETRAVEVERDGKVEKQIQTVTVPVARAFKELVPVKKCKFFTVTKEGKLETLDADKAAALLKKATPVLTGESAEVDPRQLELAKPGTLYLVLPPHLPEQILTPPGTTLPPLPKQ